MTTKRKTLVFDTSKVDVTTPRKVVGRWKRYKVPNLRMSKAATARLGKELRAAAKQLREELDELEKARASMIRRKK